MGKRKYCKECWEHIILFCSKCQKTEVCLNQGFWYEVGLPEVNPLCKECLRKESW